MIELGFSISFKLNYGCKDSILKNQPRISFFFEGVISSHL